MFKKSVSFMLILAMTFASISMLTMNVSAKDEFEVGQVIASGTVYFDESGEYSVGFGGFENADNAFTSSVDGSIGIDTTSIGLCTMNWYLLRYGSYIELELVYWTGDPFQYSYWVNVSGTIKVSGASGVSPYDSFNQTKSFTTSAQSGAFNLVRLEMPANHLREYVDVDFNWQYGTVSKQHTLDHRDTYGTNWTIAGTNYGSILATVNDHYARKRSEVGVSNIFDFCDVATGMNNEVALDKWQLGTTQFNAKYTTHWTGDAYQYTYKVNPVGYYIRVHEFGGILTIGRTW